MADRPVTSQEELQAFGDWCDSEYPDGGSGPGLAYAFEDMAEAFLAGIDWVLDTCFTQKGDQLVSVGRDMSAKLTEVAVDGIKRYVKEVKEGAFPDDDHSYAVNEPEYEKFAALVQKRRQI